MKTYIKFLLNLFFNSFFKTFFIFFIIILITNIIEQIEFFKQVDFHFIYIIFLSFLNTPSIIFEILPFIFLISTQIFFIRLIDSNELQIFKYSGVNNNEIIKIISTISFILGILLVLIFYNFSSIMKNSYLKIKNKHTNDDRYLAVITENGLWIKDEIDNNVNIINATNVSDEFLLNVVITQFDKNHDLIKTIQSPRVNIISYNWRLVDVTISKDNQISKLSELKLLSNFDLKKINSLFSNLSSLTIPELIKLRSSYKSLNYSLIEIDSQLYKVFTYPIYLTLITLLSSVIMFNIGYRKNTLFQIIFGIFLSVIIYYINYFFNVLGTSEKIPVFLSIFLPLILLAIINMISIIRLNEK
jgi:lipopolysaccharide export system permease protein